MDSTAATPEEERAGLEVPRTLLRRSGFAAAVPLFSADLAGAGDAAEATRVVTSHGHRLWTEAVSRRVRVGGDRPLDWARFTRNSPLRSWRASLPLRDDE